MVDDTHHRSQSHLLPIEGDGSNGATNPSSSSQTATIPTSRLKQPLTAVEHNGGDLRNNIIKEVGPQ